jgi:hypothetical protein
MRKPGRGGRSKGDVLVVMTVLLHHLLVMMIEFIDTPIPHF